MIPGIQNIKVLSLRCFMYVLDYYYDMRDTFCAFHRIFLKQSSNFIVYLIETFTVNLRCKFIEFWQIDLLDLYVVLITSISMVISLTLIDHQMMMKSFTFRILSKAYGRNCSYLTPSLKGCHLILILSNL